VANIRSVEIRPRFLLNGQPFPGAGAGVAVFTLWATKPSDLFDGPQVRLGTSDSPQAVRVVPGVYDVYYSWESGDLVPRNFLTRILRGVPINQDRELRIDVPMITVSGVKQHNGLDFAADGSAAELSLRCVGLRGRVPLGGTLPPDFSVRLIPGVYTFEYDRSEGATIPQNRHATVRRVKLVKDVADLVLNVPSVPQEFTFLHNGAPFPGFVSDYGNVVLKRTGSEEARAGSSFQSPTSVLLIPGTYDAHWQYVSGSTVPRNADARIRRVVVDSSPQVINVPSLEVSGAIRVNGQPPPAMVSDFARLWLETSDGADRVLLGATLEGAFNRRVVPALYDLVYEHAAGDALPSNPRAILARSWRVAAQPSRTIDIPAGTHEGTFLLNGAAFPEMVSEMGRVYFLPWKGDGDPVLAGATLYGGFERRLLPGLYRSAYEYLAGGAIVPTNTLTTFGPARRVKQGDGPATSSEILDVHAAGLTVNYQHNGVPLPEGGPQNARLHLHRGDNSLEIPESSLGAVERIAMEGRFDVFYSYVSGPGLPQNVFMPIGCWELVR
jgi:hypothetical protein